MQRIFTSARAAWLMSAGAVAFVLASHTGAASQVVDPGWQLVYAGQPGYGGDGLIESMFGDGTGQPVVARAYQPATVYQPGPMPQPPVYRTAPGYAEQPGPPQPPAYQPASANSQQPSALRPRAHQAAAVSYQQIPAQQGPVQQAPVQQVPVQQVPMQQVPAQQVRASQSAPVYYQQRPVQPAAQPVPVSSRHAAPAPRPDPQYTGALPGQEVRGLFRSAPANYQVAPAPQQGAYQPANQYPQPVPQQRVAFGYETQQQQGYAYQPQQQNYGYQGQQQQQYGYAAPAYAPPTYGDTAQQPSDPRYERQVVEYRGGQQPGTIIIDTPNFFLYLVLDGGRALRYGIGVGRPGFTWAGVKAISAKREWPDWHPPDEMLARRPDLPRYMPGGPDNPLGARALYLGSTLYRIHGSNEPWSIGTQVSSGCIRLRNADIVDLYGRVKVGTKVVVI
jgi:lipoprotein-anchoring transpeptidase ErfK/SrfK